MVVIDQPRIVIITVYKGVCQIRQLLHQAFQYIGAAYSQRQQASQIRIGFLKRRPYKADGSIPTEAERSELNFR